MHEHGLFGLGITIPLVQRSKIDLAQFPLLERMQLTLLEASVLLFSADRATEFDQMSKVPVGVFNLVINRDIRET
jgi:hypothetical protein